MEKDEQDYAKLKVGQPNYEKDQDSKSMIDWF